MDQELLSRIGLAGQVIDDDTVRVTITITDDRLPNPDLDCLSQKTQDEMDDIFNLLKKDPKAKFPHCMN